MNLIFPFTSLNIPPLDQAGGKGLALIQMTAAGMPVPPGLVITVDFFEPWLEVLKKSSTWELLTLGREIAQTAKALQKLCNALTLTENQKNELHRALSNFCEQNGNSLFAVRSSSPEEDLEGASFAGGYETTLGVKLEEIEAAIRHSFSSSFDERVFVYKRERGFPIDQPRIAVVIQQQLDADAAGVAFSLNPLNNSYDEAVINANHGLGESVVAGEADPDQFVIDKIRGEIVEIRVGGKNSVIRLNATGGTHKINQENQTNTAITSDQALELLRLLEKVEAFYKKPVDIEWALAGEKLFLLQARPITTYLQLPPEMVTSPGQPKRLYANSTLIEQGLQEPLSVLGTDFLGYVLNKVGGSMAEGSIGIDGMTFTASGGYYMNISYSMMMGMKNAALAPGSYGDPRVMEILDGIDLRQYTRGELPKKLKVMRQQMVFKMLPMIKEVLKAYFRPTQVLQNYKDALPDQNQRLETFTTEGRSLHEQASALTSMLSFFYGDYGIPMILAGQLAMQRIRGIFKNEMLLAQDHLINLGIALPGNKTTEMGEVMYDLASATEFKRFNSFEEFDFAMKQGSVDLNFVARWEKFLAEFGFRCPGEIDPATSRPSENPKTLFDQLKIMAVDHTGSFFDKARNKRESAYQALYALALSKGKNKARAFERYYNRWVTFGGFRETPKYYVIKVISVFRRQALSVGQELTAAGRLDFAEQIFDLTIADIDRAGNDPLHDLRELAKQRSAIIRKIRKSKLTARIIDSRGKIFYPPRNANTNGGFNGVPISPGVVQGRVKVLNYASEKPLLPGEILVARATDPGWTPLFINAAGIILEIGGALQHGAVVAREYGIPCVSGLDNATILLKDGQWVEVDGSNGVVRILESFEK